MSPTFRFIPAIYRAAVVDRVKTQTRRVISRLPCQYSDQQWLPQEMCNTTPEGWQTTGHSGRWWCECCHSADEAIESTYGPPGTILPVVTTWAVHSALDGQLPLKLGWGLLQDHSPKARTLDEMPRDAIWWDDGTPKPEWAGKSRPAMFFPKHLYPLARQAKVVGVKAERVHSISKADVLAEGITQIQIDLWKPWLHAGDCAAHAYGVLWDSINAERGKGALKGQYAWARNPWVFATTFEVLPAE